jgi:putative acetyltransferase
MPTIRKYQDSDVEAVLSAWENAQDLAHPFLPKDFQAQEKINVRELYLPNAETWVIENDNKVVGFIALIGNKIGGLFLQPTQHGKKLGKMMVDKAQELYGDLVVEVFKNNLAGRDFYEKYGFKFVEEKKHEQTGEQVFRLEFTVNCGRD